MQAKLSRYKKAILSCLCVLTVAISVCSFSLESKAAVIDEYYLDYAEPTCSDSQGYISLAVRKNSTGIIEIHTFFWNAYALGGEDEKPFSMYCDITDDTVLFRPYVNTDIVDTAWISVTHIDQNGVFIPYRPMTTSAPSWSWGANGYTLLGFKYGGNALGDWEYPQSYSFALYFATDGSAQQLMYIYSLIQHSNSINQTQLNTLLSIVNQQSTTNQKLDEVKTYLNSIRGDLTDISEQLDEILGEEKKQTSWLQKIWESLQDFLGKEPAEDSTAPADPEDNLGSIKDSEETLIPDTSEAEESLDVELNSGFSVLTWLVDTFAKLDPGVFSMYLSMMTFGVIALLLGR